MATTVDATGKLAGRHALAFCLMLFPVTVAAIWPANLINVVLLILALGLAVWYLKAAVVFWKKTDTVTSRRLFRVSLGYLTAYLALLSICALVQ